MMKTKYILVLICLCFSQSLFAQSGNISTSDLSSDFYKSTVGLSMGGAYRALADTTQAVLYNPAGMKLHKSAVMASGDYAYIGSYADHMYGVSVIDTQTNDRVAYGLSYHRSHPNFGGIIAKNNQAMLSAAHQTGKILAGASVKAYWVQIDSANLEGPKGIDFDAGLLFKPSEQLSIGVVGYNLVRGKNIEEYPLQAAVAAALTIIPQATVTVDLVKNFNTTSDENVNVHIGGVVSVSDQIMLRGGYAKDRIFSNDYFGLGLSVLAKQARLHFSFGQTINQRSEIYSASLEYRM